MVTPRPRAHLAFLILIFVAGGCSQPEESCQPDCAGKDCGSDGCGGSCGACDDVPADTCGEGDLLLVYGRTGDCQQGACAYTPEERACPFGCEEAACLPDPCDPVTCDQPPGPCHEAIGACVADPEPRCEYDPLEDGIGCEDGDDCTEGDTCQAGVCTPGANTCDRDVTLLVYMAADNDLDEWMIEDLYDMEAGNPDDIPWLRAFVLIDRAPFAAWTDTRLYEVHNLGSQELEAPTLGLTVDGIEELNTGDPSVLGAFLQDVEDIVGEDTDTFLVLANHGDGWWKRPDPGGTGNKGCCYDETSADDYLSELEIHGAIHGIGITLLGYDACMEAMAEVAYEHREDARYLLASQEMEGGWGWDWTELLLQWGLSDDPSAMTFATLTVDTYMDLSQAWDDDTATMSVLDLTGMDALAAAATPMATALAAISTDDFDAICDGLVWYGCDATYCEDYVDLQQLAELARGVDPDHAAAYDEVIARIADVVVYERHFDGHKDAHGVNVYYPCFYWPYEEYADNTWAVATGWGDMVNAH